MLNSRAQRSMRVAVVALLCSLVVTIIALAAVIVDHPSATAAPMAHNSSATHNTATVSATTTTAAKAPTSTATTHPAATPTTKSPPMAVPTATPRTQTTAAGTQTTNGCQITSDQLAAEQHLLSLVNQHRAAAGVPALTLDPTLSAGARTHSCDMAQHHQLSHNGSDGSTPFQRIQAEGITYHAAGENIGTASGYGLQGGVDTNDTAMMQEPLVCCNHHWNIVDKDYQLIGIGIIYINGTEWLTEDFVG